MFQKILSEKNFYCASLLNNLPLLSISFASASLLKNSNFLSLSKNANMPAIILQAAPVINIYKYGIINTRTNHTTNS